ncbi:hypothetical protein M8J76_007101 [Diaphorina citri]|nr:hypothetical protein M8J75_010009 [Diaphorina citri]KAI5733054.1 hypothetical protein M8J76_007101 [Diaphorina citri]KAI5739128.1 hypothetical protein M8J77_015379 [Diaphorina citri]
MDTPKDALKMDAPSTPAVNTEDLLNDIKLNAQRPELFRPIKLQVGQFGSSEEVPDRTLLITNITKFLPIVPQEIWSPHHVVAKQLKPSFNDFVTRI